MEARLQGLGAMSNGCATNLTEHPTKQGMGRRNGYHARLHGSPERSRMATVIAVSESALPD